MADGSVKNVKICGPKDILSELKASDLYAVADLSAKSEGSYTVSVIVKSDKYNTIWQVGSYKVFVNIK